MTGDELLQKIKDRDDPTSLRDIPAPEVYTVRQVAGLLGLNLGITYELVRKGEIPAKRLGRRWLVPRAAFHAWLTDLSAVAS
jgi:excisionase family DNA binding protein